MNASLRKIDAIGSIESAAFSLLPAASLQKVG